MRRSHVAKPEFRLEFLSIFHQIRNELVKSVFPGMGVSRDSRATDDPPVWLKAIKTALN